MRKIKDLARNVLLLLIVIFVCLCFFEVTLRVIKYDLGRILIVNEAESYMRRTPWIKEDLILGYRLMPGIEDRLIRSEFNTLVRINNKGLRDNEVPYQKTNKKRAIFLGDSFTFGHGAEMEQMFSKVLVNKYLTNWESVNLGVPGYSTDQQLLYLKNEGLKYFPDIVVLMFHSRTDSFENMRSFLLKDYYTKKPLFRLKDGKLVLDKVPASRPGLTLSENIDLALMRNSRTYLFIKAKLFSLMRSQDFRNIWTMLKHKLLGRESYEWQLTEKLILEIESLSEKHNAKFLLVHIPDEEYVTGNTIPFYMSDYNEFLKEFAAENKIAFLELTDDLRETNKIVFYPEDNHFNVDGNEAVAKLIYEKLINGGLV